MGMSMEFVNRICPNCKDPNYMVFLGEFSKVYKYKCMNCNGYFNDIDFEKEPLKPVWKSECMNTKIDMVEVVRCKYCKHATMTVSGDLCKYCEMDTDEFGAQREVYHDADWFCADGERRDDDA